MTSRADRTTDTLPPSRKLRFPHTQRLRHFPKCRQVLLLSEAAAPQPTQHSRERHLLLLYTEERWREMMTELGGEREREKGKDVLTWGEEKGELGQYHTLRKTGERGLSCNKEKEQRSITLPRRQQLHIRQRQQQQQQRPPREISAASTGNYCFGRLALSAFTCCCSITTES